jgi:hypothetical protein
LYGTGDTLARLAERTGVPAPLSAAIRTATDLDR